MVMRLHGVGSTGSRPRPSRLRWLSAIAVDASNSAHTSAESTARLASDAASSGAPALLRVTRAAARRRVEVALRTLDDGQVEGGGEVGQPNGHVPASAPRAAAAVSQIDPPRPLSPQNEPLSSVACSASTVIAAATLNASGDSDDKQDAVTLTQLLASVIADAEVVSSSLPSSLSFIPATEPLPSLSHGELDAGSLPSLIRPPLCPLPLLPQLPPLSQSTFVPSSVASSYLPSPPSVPPAGPQRVLVPVRIASSVDEREGAGPRSLVTGICDGHAADGKDREGCGVPEAHEGRAGSEGSSDVQIVGALLYDEPIAPTGRLTMPELASLPHAVLALKTMGGGRCSIAAPMLAMGLLPDCDPLFEDVDHSPLHRRIDAERLLLGYSMSALWTEERWVREVPVDLRMSRVDGTAIAQRTSYDILHEMLTDSQQCTAWMEPSVYYVAAEMYELGIFVVTWHPERGNSAAH